MKGQLLLARASSATESCLSADETPIPHSPSFIRSPALPSAGSLSRPFAELPVACVASQFKTQTAADQSPASEETGRLSEPAVNNARWSLVHEHLTSSQSCGASWPQIASAEQVETQTQIHGDPESKDNVGETKSDDGRLGQVGFSPAVECLNRRPVGVQKTEIPNCCPCS